MAHPPLTLPPDNTLRPPEPGAPRPQEGTASEQAQTALYANNGGTAPALSAASDASTGRRSRPARWRVQNAGAVGADPGIRAQIDTETAAQIERDQTLISRLVFWRTQEPYGTVVDPVAESKRLQENQALGKPVTEGETPIIPQRKKGVLDVSQIPSSITAHACSTRRNGPRRLSSRRKPGPIDPASGI